MIRTGFPVLLAGLALGLAACGSGGSSTTSAARPVSTQTPLQPGATGNNAGAPDRNVVNDVCQAVRQGSPTPLVPPFTARKITRYSQSAQPVAKRTVTSLRRLAGSGAPPALSELVRAYRQLQVTYAAASIVTQDPKAADSIGQQIAASELAVNATAQRAKLPACAVVGR